jgi:D-arginine dehydrogenase
MWVLGFPHLKFLMRTTQQLLFSAHKADAIVLGAGIVGSGISYELVQRGLKVICLERETRAGYHSTGRSAALFSEGYGPPLVRRLTIASKKWMVSPPTNAFGSFASSLLSPRGVVWVTPNGQEQMLQQIHHDLKIDIPSVSMLNKQQILERAPIVKAEWTAECGMWEPEATDIDVHRFHQGYFRGAFNAASHSRIVTGRAGEAVSITNPHIHNGSGSRDWTVTTTEGSSYQAPLLINSAGAWADEIAEMANVRPIGLIPKRRTCINFDDQALPERMRDCGAWRRWAMVMDAQDNWYFKPDAGQVCPLPNKKHT